MKPSYIISSIIAVLVIIGLIIYFSVRSSDNSDYTDENIPKNQNEQPTATPSVQYSFTEIAQHKIVSDCWTVYNDKVYNITNLIPNYTGDKSMLTAICGRDGTPTIDYIGQSIINMLQPYRIGFLESKL